MEIKTKFSNGDKVFIMHENKPKMGEVYCINTRNYRTSALKIYYDIELDERKPVMIGTGERIKVEHVAQRKVYATKKELIEDL
jgi:hypothetical protein